MYKLLFILCTIFTLTNACKITLMVRSTTTLPFKFEVLIPSTGLRTQKALFNQKDQQKKVVIDAGNCAGKHWTFVTYKQAADGEWVKAQEHTGRFDGQGDLGIQVPSDFIPRVVSRQGVYCGETLICG